MKTSLLYILSSRNNSRCRHLLFSRIHRNFSSEGPVSSLANASIESNKLAISDSANTAVDASQGAVNTLFPAWEYITNSSILWPSNMIERGLELLHFHSGLGWAATLVLYTVSLRALLFPISVSQTRSTILAHNLKPKVQALQAEAHALREKGQVEQSRSKILELSKFMSVSGINPAKILGLSLVPLPFFMATFFAVRNMANQPISSMTEGGLLWFTNLCTPDPYYILPAISTATLLLSLELARFSSPTQGMSPGMKLGLRIFAAASFPVLAFMPSGLVLYFCTSNLLTCLVHGLWAIKAARRLFKIPNVNLSPAIAPQKSFLETFRESYQAHLRDQSAPSSTYEKAKNVLNERPVKVLSHKPKF